MKTLRQGGIEARSAMAFLKLLVDGIHHDDRKTQASFTQLIEGFLPPGAKRDATLAAGIASIAFHDSVCVIAKSAARGTARLGERLVAGTEATVRPEVLALRRGG
jgi:hypothetical protein